MKTKLLVITAVVAALGNLAYAQPEGRRQVRANRGASTQARLGHGARTYQTALRFAQENRLQHFTVPMRNGQQRLVVNVTNEKAAAWNQVFSKANGYIEPFFNASATSGPGWSQLRMGNKRWKSYGQGSDFRAETYGGRVAFPLSLSSDELRTTESCIVNGTNAPFNYNGGDPERTGRNCTNWVTYKIGQYTGVTTNSVVGHMSSMVRGSTSDRMSVMAVMSSQALPSFDAQIVSALAASALTGG